MVTKEPSACHLVTVHNIAHQVITRLSNMFPSQTCSLLKHFTSFQNNTFLGVTKRIGLQPLWMNCLSLSAAVDEEVARVNCWGQVKFLFFPWKSEWMISFCCSYPGFLPLYKISSTSCSPTLTLLPGLGKLWPVLALSFHHDSALVYLLTCVVCTKGER